MVFPEIPERPVSRVHQAIKVKLAKRANQEQLAQLVDVDQPDATEQQVMLALRDQLERLAPSVKMEFLEKEETMEKWEIRAFRDQPAQ